MGDPAPPPSARVFEQRVAAAAHAARGKPYEPPAAKRNTPLVPIYVGIDKDADSYREVGL